MLLREGETITTKELIQWIGVSRGTYSKKKEEYLKEIKESYFDFEPVYGGLVIKEVYNEDVTEYVKINLKKDKVQKRMYKLYDKTWNKDTGLDTNKNVVGKILESEPWMLDEYSLSTLETIGNNIRCRLYGKQFDRAGGEIGTCIYVLATRDKRTKKLRFLNEGEMLLKRKLFSKYFTNAEDATQVVQCLVDEGVVEEKDAWRYFQTILCKDKKGWGAFFGEMKEAGCPLVRATLVERDGVQILVEEEDKAARGIVEVMVMEQK